MSDRGMALVITMAGLGTRFRAAGYECPKYLIKAKDRTLLEWSLLSLSDYLPHVREAVFAVRAQDGMRDVVLAEAERLGVPGARVLELPAPTDGQATTCMMATEGLDRALSLMVYNIDTYVEPGGLRYADLSGDGHVPCFEAPGDHWSFVRLGTDGLAVEVREKERVSGMCSLGAYWFSSVGLFQRAYSSYYGDAANVEKGEKYVAPLYNWLIAEGLPVTASLVDAGKVHVLGTPEELAAFEEGR